MRRHKPARSPRREREMDVEMRIRAHQRRRARAREDDTPEAVLRDVLRIRDQAEARGLTDFVDVCDGMVERLTVLLAKRGERARTKRDDGS